MRIAIPLISSNFIIQSKENKIGPLLSVRLLIRVFSWGDRRATWCLAQGGYYCCISEAEGSFIFLQRVMFGSACDHDCDSAALTNIYYSAHHDNPADLFGCFGQCLVLW